LQGSARRSHVLCHHIKALRAFDQMAKKPQPKTGTQNVSR
jgi:hypothetical protein